MDPASFDLPPSFLADGVSTGVPPGASPPAGDPPPLHHTHRMLPNSIWQRSLAQHLLTSVVQHLAEAPCTASADVCCTASGGSPLHSICLRLLHSRLATLSQQDTGSAASSMFVQLIPLQLTDAHIAGAPARVRHVCACGRACAYVCVRARMRPCMWSAEHPNSCIGVHACGTFFVLSYYQLFSYYTLSSLRQFPRKLDAPPHRSSHNDSQLVRQSGRMEQEEKRRRKWRRVCWLRTRRMMEEEPETKKKKCFPWMTYRQFSSRMTIDLSNHRSRQDAVCRNPPARATAGRRGVGDGAVHGEGLGHHGCRVPNGRRKQHGVALFGNAGKRCHVLLCNAKARSFAPALRPYCRRYRTNALGSCQRPRIDGLRLACIAPNAAECCRQIEMCKKTLQKTTELLATCGNQPGNSPTPSWTFIMPILFLPPRACLVSCCSSPRAASSEQQKPSLLGSRLIWGKERKKKAETTRQPCNFGGSRDRLRTGTRQPKTCPGSANYKRINKVFRG